MRISTFFYTLKQGIKNIFRNAWYSLASVATISACLLLFGIFFAIVANFSSILKTSIPPRTTITATSKIITMISGALFFLGVV